MGLFTSPLMTDSTGKRLAANIKEYLTESANPMGWADCPEELLGSVMDQAYLGALNLETDLGWHEGDIRTVNFGDTGKIEWVLTDPGHFDLEQGGKCKFVIIANNTPTNITAINWADAATRNAGWIGYGTPRMNYVRGYIDDMPDNFVRILKPFYIYSTTACDSSALLEKISETLTLPAEKEITGECTHGNPQEGATLSQLNYFKTSSNLPCASGNSGSAKSKTNYWTRSVKYKATFDNNIQIVYVNSNGSVGLGGYNNTNTKCRLMACI